MSSTEDTAIDLPVRIVDGPLTEEVICVDGSVEAPGLQLSHWPGNRTPRELRHDLSTGSALAFARLDPARRRELSAGATAIVNNHFDTDGTCALFAVRHPRAAVARSQALLDAAAAGDFFQMPSEEAFIVNAIVGAISSSDRSPIADLAGTERERHQAATEWLLEHMPAILDGDTAELRPLWEAELEGVRADLSDLGQCARDEIAHLDWTVWSAAQGSRSSRAGASDGFDPGRHALFGSTSSDRILVIGPSEAGTSYRLLFSTLSWFDLVSHERSPRPDLEQLARRLNALEGSAPEESCAWRWQDSSSPTPELWFGLAPHPRFAEHAPCLRPSRIDPRRLRREVADSLRSRLSVP